MPFMDQKTEARCQLHASVEGEGGKSSVRLAQFR